VLNNYYGFAKKVIKLISLCAFFLLFTGNLQKDYRLIFFRFGPEDLLLKVFPENNDKTDENNTDYIMSKIENGAAHIFLVKKSPNERNIVDYKYKIVLYKPQIINGNTINIPIYSFGVYFDDDDAVAVYEPSKALPKEIKENNLEKKFARSPGTNIYFLKDYNGEDFMLKERMRKVKFLGKIKNANGSYTTITDDYKINVKLIKKDDINNVSVSENIDSINSFVIPINNDIIVGLAPYKIDTISEKERYILDSIVVDKVEKTDTFIHFAEVWDTMYEQELIFVDDGYHIDFKFDKNLYNLEYSYDDGDVNRYDNSPLSISIKENSDKKLKISLIGKDFAVKYLKNPTTLINCDLSSDMKALETVKKISYEYPNTEILEDGSLYIKPDFNKTSFAILSSPIRTKIKYKILDPIYSENDGEYKEIGETPIFFSDLDYGKYSFVAYWYEKDERTLLVNYVTDEVVVEFSDPKSKKYISDIKYFQKNETSIPYIEFNRDTVGKRKNPIISEDTSPDLSERKNDIDVDLELTKIEDKDVVTSVVENTSDITDKIETKDKIEALLDNKYDSTTDKINTSTDKVETTMDKNDVTTDKIEIVNNENNKIQKKIDNLSGYLPIKFQSIKKDDTKLFYIQIASYRLRKENVYYIECFGDFFIAEYKNKFGKNFENNPKVAYKSIEGNKFLALLLGPFDYETAESYLSSVYFFAEDAFMVSQEVLEEYR